MNDIFNYLNIPKDHQLGFLNYLDLGKKNSRSVNVFFYLLKLVFGIIISDFIHFFQNKNHQKTIFNNNVFITHYSTIIKAKELVNIFSENELTVLYLPTIHIRSKYKHINYFKNDSNVFFDYFGLKVFLFSFSLLKDTFFLMKIQKNYKEDFPHIIRVVLKYKIFIKYSEKLTDADIKNKKNWILDNDRDGSFSAIVGVMRQTNANTINMQHGLFFEGNKFYLPSISKYVFCCTSREKELFKRAGHNENNIFVLGAPLQSINSHIKKVNVSIQYDVLILLANTSNETLRLMAQKSVLNVLKNFDNKKILLRFRPASENQDKAKLLDDLYPNFYISKNSTLTDDVSRSKEIISFSFDALYECFRLKKRVYFICEDNIFSQLRSSKNPILVPYSSINKLTYYFKEELTVDFGEESYDFGSPDFDAYSSRIKKYCDLLIQKIRG